MAWDVGIADRLRRYGLKVVEVDGWKTRGSSVFTPRGSVNHHTAGPRKGNAPSLGICINGRSDLPGPLCNVFQARDNTVYVVAAGRANHAGSGGWKGLKGNSSVYGLEIEHTGTAAEPWTPDRIKTAATIHAALLDGKISSEFVCQHKEWTPRKIDAFGIEGNAFRRMVKEITPSQVNPIPPSGELTMSDVNTILKKLDTILEAVIKDVAAQQKQFDELKSTVSEIQKRVHSMHAGNYGEGTTAASGNLKFLDDRLKRIACNCGK